MCEKTTSNIILHGERLKALFSEIRNKTKMYTSTTFMQHSTVSPIQSSQARKISKLEREKKNHLCRFLDPMYRKP